MGSDLYLSIEVSEGPVLGGHAPWWPLFEGASTDVGRGPVVDAFGSAEESDAGRAGYLTPFERDRAKASDPRCPWRDHDPYWVRLMEGDVFVESVARVFQECRSELRAFHACVQSILLDGRGVRVWLWHSP